MKSTLALILLLPLVWGCSQLQLQRDQAQRQLRIERNWVRSTPTRDYIEFRRVHRMQPILTDSLVIQGNSIDGLVAYDRKDIYEVWRLAIDGGVEAGAQLFDGHLYFGAGDGQFYKVNALTGQVVWTFPIRAEGLGEPFVAGGKVYFVAGNNVAYCLDAKTGKSDWLYNRRDPSTLSIRGGSRPNVDGEKVYMGFSDGYLVALNKANGSLVWEAYVNKNKRFQDVDAFPVIDGNRIYISSYDGALYALNKNSGEVIWQVDQGGFSAPLVTKEVLYYSTSNNQLMALDKNSGKVIWQEMTKSLATRPVIYKGMLVVGEFSGRLKFLSLQTGRLINSFHPGRGVTSEPSIDESKNEVYFMSADANLFALMVSWERPEKIWHWED